jgi:histidyl-tRNA synthetase
MTDRKIYKPRPISGFPEWLPEYRAVEQAWMDHFRRVFESYGYTNIETPAVEELGVLAAKGEVDKEIYVLERLHKDEGEKSEARLALHFDQTVPMARYVAQHFSDLTFPFKRYQMQKVWRGERPQRGRLREFYQCDIDVIGIDNLPLHFDAEMPAVMFEALSGIGLGRVQIKVSNRKILLGLLQGIDCDPVAVMRIVDKLDKVGEQTVRDLLIKEQSLAASDVDQIVELIQFRSNAVNILNISQVIAATNDMTKAGIEELIFVMQNLSHLPDHAVQADLSIIRGLDYYTGTVYEAKLLDEPDFTSTVCAGGRYDDLAGQYINKNLPGVGISIGLSRLFDVLLAKGKITPGRKCPTDVLVVLPSDEARAAASATAQALRARGLNVELYHKAAKTGDQITYANKKGIPYVWFPGMAVGEPHRVKTLADGRQIDNVDPAVWTPVKENR